MNGGETIRHYRNVLGMSQQALAVAVGMSMPAVAQWEKGIIKRPPRETLEKVEAALDAGGEILSAYGYGVESATEISQLRTELEALRGEARRGRDYLWDAIELVASKIEEGVRGEVEEMHRSSLANGDALSAGQSPQRARRRA